MRGAIRRHQASSGAIRRTCWSNPIACSHRPPFSSAARAALYVIVLGATPTCMQSGTPRHSEECAEALNGNQVSSEALSGNQVSLEALSGNHGLIRGTQRQSGLIRGTQRQSGLIMGTQSTIRCQSAAISRNRSQSAAITWRICSRRASASFHRPPLAHAATAALKLITFGLTP